MLAGIHLCHKCQDLLSLCKWNACVHRHLCLYSHTKELLGVESKLIFTLQENSPAPDGSLESQIRDAASCRALSLVSRDATGSFAKITENLCVCAVSQKMNTKRDRKFRKRKMK